MSVLGAPKGSKIVAILRSVEIVGRSDPVKWYDLNFGHSRNFSRESE